ncbi:battenin-like isoform X2 [Corticium candelabrum]|uniref:battenin-like isoform X2 n=1 Tax=Corticium candelabrum TaxID=121492 RepID=UPI002E275728|nr:battenin-like isoform X2 [Corticium candelabrum]
MSVIAMDEMSVPPVGYEAEDGRRGADSQTDCNDDDVHSTSNGSEGTENPASMFQVTMSWRNVVAFWIFGLCNNFGYVIMLSAAHDILFHETNSSSTSTPSPSVANSTNDTNCKQLICNKQSTGIVLLADILPTLLIKLCAPWFMNRIPYVIRIFVVIVFAAASFLVVALAHENELSLFACASVSAGFGEITFLSYTSHFHKSSVSAWSSGTGAAGMIGALSYASIAGWLGPRDAILVMLFVPALLLVSYLFILDRSVMQTSSDVEPLLPDSEKGSRTVIKTMRDLPFTTMLLLLRPLLKYMVPLFFVYMAEYLINQGLMELLTYSQCVSWIGHKAQYRWFQTLYQTGVFISRSSVNVFPIDKIWLLSLLQWVNFVFLFLVARFQFIPATTVGVLIIFGIILYEGLLGGGTYVNAFYRITKEVEPQYKEFSMGVASCADSTGIGVAGGLAIPIHSYICDLLGTYN